MLDIRVFTLGDGPSATKLKLMEIKGANAISGKNGFIESQYGFRFLTIMVSKTTASVEKAPAAGAKPIAKGTFAIPKDIADGMYLTIYKDLDGNFFELVGTKK